MKKYVILLIVILSGISNAMADNQKFVVAHKDGKARFVQVENLDGNWQYVNNVEDLYLDNGVELEGFEIDPDESLNYKGTPYVCSKELLVKYDGKYYIAVNPKKSVMPVNENGETTADLGIRNYLSNTFLGDFYRTKTPGLIGLVCAIISGIILFAGMFKDTMSLFMRWAAMLPLCIISILEIGAVFSVGADATWWVNPDDVGYWIATPLLIPYSIAAAMMILSLRLYKFVGKVNGHGNSFITIMLLIGTVLTVISAIYVVINFVFAVCCLIFGGWLFKGMSYTDYNGNTISSGPLGTYKTDRYGTTTRVK